MSLFWFFPRHYFTRFRFMLCSIHVQIQGLWVDDCACLNELILLLRSRSQKLKVVRDFSQFDPIKLVDIQNWRDFEYHYHFRKFSCIRGGSWRRARNWSFARLPPATFFFLTPNSLLAVIASHLHGHYSLCYVVHRHFIHAYSTKLIR